MVVSIPMTGAGRSVRTVGERDLPGSLLSAYHISYKGLLLVVAMMMLLVPTPPHGMVRLMELLQT